MLSHDVIFEHSELPLPAVAVAFVAAWQIMIGAMMLPTALPVVGMFSAQARGSQPRAGLAIFLGAYFAVWTGFGVLALGTDAAVHALVDTWAWLAARPSLVAATVLLLAAVYQFLPVKRRCLRECRDPVALLVGNGPVRGAWWSAVRYGTACLGSNGLLMLVMFAVGIHALWWIVLLTLVLVAEKMLPGCRWTVPAVGAGLGSAGLLVALT